MPINCAFCSCCLDHINVEDLYKCRECDKVLKRLQDAKVMQKEIICFYCNNCYTTLATHAFIHDPLRADRCCICDDSLKSNSEKHVCVQCLQMNILKGVPVYCNECVMREPLQFHYYSHS